MRYYMIWLISYVYIYIELNIDRCKSPAFSKLSQNMNGLRLDLRSTLQRFILFGAHSGRYLKYRKVKAMLPQPTMDSQPEDEAFPPVSCLTWRREIRPFLKREIYGNIIEINAGFSMSQMWNNVKVTWIKSQVRIDFCKCQPPDLRFWASQSTYWWVMSLVYFRPPLFLSFFQLVNLGLILPESPLVSFAGGCISPSLVDKTFPCQKCMFVQLTT